MQDVTMPTRALPHINEQGDLIIPFDAPLKYHYWKPGGQTIWQTLAELNAPLEVVRRYERGSDKPAKQG